MSRRRTTVRVVTFELSSWNTYTFHWRLHLTCGHVVRRATRRRCFTAPPRFVKCSKCDVAKEVQDG